MRGLRGGGIKGRGDGRGGKTSSRWGEGREEGEGLRGGIRGNLHNVVMAQAIRER